MVYGTILIFAIASVFTMSPSERRNHYPDFGLSCVNTFLVTQLIHNKVCMFLNIVYSNTRKRLAYSKKRNRNNISYANNVLNN